MGSIPDQGEWKGAHMRINSHEPGGSLEDTGSKKGDDLELQDREQGTSTDADIVGGGPGRSSRRKFPFPRLGLDALIHDGRPEDNGIQDGSIVFYKVYKRRWFGLVELTLLSLLVSWEWLTFSPVAAIAADFFNTTESAINWFSTSFLFAFVVMVPLVIYTLHWGPKPSILTAALLMLIGNWIRYAGVRASTPSFGVVMFGQIILGFAQPFVLAGPTRYSDMWFTNRGRVAATALMSLSNPFGAAIGQLVVPFWVYKSSDIPNAVLYLSIITTIVCIPAFFIPAAPPTPPSPSGATQKMSLIASIRTITSSFEVWLLLIPFFVYVSLFNSISTIISQVLTPYGFSDSDAGIAGAVLIVVGLVSAAITSPILDRTKSFVLACKVAAPLIALCYLIFIWMPETRSDAGPYVVLAALGAASFSLVPVAMELLVELTHPVSPEVTSTLAWAGGQLGGGIFILISDALKAGNGASPPGNMKNALIFQAVVALVALPFPMFLGLFGRGDKVLLRRVQRDQEDGVLAQERVGEASGHEASM
ncbi:hypothetical protein N0V82_001489 [Gnomoniopsis sp. IMI 355080]|nr:hypothetical protein N0V82_001489 [Gnomoniopsis sp. IMI 355080]